MEAFLALLGAVVGYVLRFVQVLVVESRRERRADEREQSECQREILAELQEELQRMAFVAAQQTHSKRMAYKNSGVWQLQHWRPELDEADINARTRVIALTSRVADAETRRLVDDFRKAQIDWMKSQSLEEDLSVHDKFYESFDLIMERTGAQLRAQRLHQSK